MIKSKMWEGKATPRIVCAANLHNNGERGEFILIGPRHCDSTMREQLSIYKVVLSEHGVEPSIKVEQGFIDQFGDFHTRQEAWKIAEANGQIYRRCGGDDANGGTLYSENLY